MAFDPDGDLGVDVLIIGAGIQGLYLAGSLRDRYTVCVVADPAVRAATLDAPGHVSAGYEGNDAARMQPARRAAGFWRLWAEANGLLPGDAEPVYHVAPAAGDRLQVWAEATLAFHEAGRVPDALEGGSLAGEAAYVLDNDVVIHPGALLTRLHAAVADRCVAGEVVDVSLAADRAVDAVEVQVADRLVPIVPRFTVLAAGTGNAGLLSTVAKRMADRGRRRERQEQARVSQAVGRSTVLCLRGRGLPRLTGWFDGLSIVSHAAGTETVWVVSPAEDQQVVLGPEDLRFDPPVDPAAVATTVDRLFALSPAVARAAGDLRWTAYGTRRALHPMLAGADAATVGRPVPARLDAFDLEAFLALWPSHLGYAMVLGDVVAERIAEALGPRGDFSDGLQVPDVAAAAPLPVPTARWDREDQPWRDWADFCRTHGLGPG
jgi:hypothetical protein